MSSAPWQGARTHWLDVSIVSVVVAFATAVLGVVIPVNIDRDAWERERRATCVEALVDVRAAMREISVVYESRQEIDSQAWSSGSTAIERSRVLCIRDLSAEQSEELGHLAGMFTTDRNRTLYVVPDVVETSSVDAILDWTEDLIVEKLE